MWTDPNTSDTESGQEGGGVVANVVEVTHETSAAGQAVVAMS